MVGKGESLANKGQEEKEKVGRGKPPSLRCRDCGHRSKAWRQVPKGTGWSDLRPPAPP